MSWDDKLHMQMGFRVRHKYKRRRGCHAVCERCGVKRRATSSGWEYWHPSEKRWMSSNPHCVRRETAEAK